MEKEALDAGNVGERPWLNDRAGGAGRGSRWGQWHGGKCMKLEMERVDENGPERVIISTGTRSLHGKVGRKAIMGPRNDK